MIGEENMYTTSEISPPEENLEGEILAHSPVHDINPDNLHSELPRHFGNNHQQQITRSHLHVRYISCCCRLHGKLNCFFFVNKAALGL